MLQACDDCDICHGDTSGGEFICLLSEETAKAVLIISVTGWNLRNEKMTGLNKYFKYFILSNEKYRFVINCGMEN